MYYSTIRAPVGANKCNQCDYISSQTSHYRIHLKNFARISNAVPLTFNSKATMNGEIVVLNFQKCNQCTIGHALRKWEIGKISASGLIFCSFTFESYLGTS